MVSHMSNNAKKMYIIVGTIWLLLSAFLIISVPHVRFATVAAAIAAAAMIFAGLSPKTEYEQEDGHDRDGLMAKSLLPGYIQLAVFRERGGIAQLVVFLIGLTLAAIGMNGLISNDPELIHEAFMMSLYGMTVVFFSITWSALEVNEYCNKRKMPFDGGIFEMRWNNTELGLKILAGTVLIVLISLTAGFYYGNVM
ncbi:MAG: hypothetical protein LBJ20_08025 [Candidatus Methanoplasma sp.]|jgi:hypothetical protein|nr:hypothetical protein [Candidatus Methanoplasma sp.]